MIDLQAVPTASLLAEIQRRCDVCRVIPVWAEPHLREVAAVFGMTIEELAANHSRVACWPRFVAIAILRERKGRSWEEIAGIWLLTHGAAVCAAKRVRSRIKTDSDFARLLQPLFPSSTLSS